MAALWLRWRNEGDRPTHQRTSFYLTTAARNWCGAVEVAAVIHAERALRGAGGAGGSRAAVRGARRLVPPRRTRPAPGSSGSAAAAQPGRTTVLECRYFNDPPYDSNFNLLEEEGRDANCRAVTLHADTDTYRGGAGTRGRGEPH